jgi:hypothetical protein
MSSISHSQYESVASCIHFHTPDEKLASADGHSLPSRACSLQTTSYSLSVNVKLPFFASHGIYTNNSEKMQKPHSPLNAENYI